MLVRNVRDNLPPNWKVQIFYNGKGQSKNAIEINKGIQRMIDSGDVVRNFFFQFLPFFLLFCHFFTILPIFG